MFEKKLVLFGKEIHLDNYFQKWVFLVICTWWLNLYTTSKAINIVANYYYYCYHCSKIRFEFVLEMILPCNLHLMAQSIYHIKGDQFVANYCSKWSNPANLWQKNVQKYFFTPLPGWGGYILSTSVYHFNNHVFTWMVKVIGR